MKANIHVCYCTQTLESPPVAGQSDIKEGHGKSQCKSQYVEVILLLYKHITWSESGSPCQPPESQEFPLTTIHKVGHTQACVLMLFLHSTSGIFCKP